MTGKTLPPFYDTAYRMLGAEVNPKLCAGDKMLQRRAQKINREDEFHATKVSIFFAREGQNLGKPKRSVFRWRCPDRALSALQRVREVVPIEKLIGQKLFVSAKRGATILAETSSARRDDGEKRCGGFPRNSRAQCVKTCHARCFAPKNHQNWCFRRGFGHQQVTAHFEA